MVKRLINSLALLGLLISLLPNATSLYGFTGEEELRGQAAGILHWLNTAIRPQPQLAPDAVTAHLDVNSLGMNTFLEQEAEIIKRDESLRLLSETGLGFIRQEFTWEDIEIHAKGDFIDRRNDPNGVSAWDKYDHIVELAEKHNIQIIARLSNPPSWSRAEPDEVSGEKAPPDDFADFSVTVAERYQGRITYFQIWNEPNIYDEWGEQRSDPEAFTELLCLAHDRIKAVNLDAVILAPALSPTLAMDGFNVNKWQTYLPSMWNKKTD